MGDETKKATSGAFTRLPQKVMQELKEAFAMIDANRDGLIDLDDLKEIYSQFGRTPNDKDLNEMLKEAPGPLNFTMFLTLFGDKVGGTDSESTLYDAFKMFDEEGKGKIPEAYLKDLLQNMGDNFTADEVRQTWKEAPIAGGQFDFAEFVSIVKGKQQDEA